MLCHVKRPDLLRPGMPCTMPAVSGFPGHFNFLSTRSFLQSELEVLHLCNGSDTEERHSGLSSLYVLLEIGSKPETSGCCWVYSTWRDQPHDVPGAGETFPYMSSSICEDMNQANASLFLLKPLHSLRFKAQLGS